jgi:hypothetical protein
MLPFLLQSTFWVKVPGELWVLRCANAALSAIQTMTASAAVFKSQMPEQPDFRIAHDSPSGRRSKPLFRQYALFTVTAKAERSITAPPTSESPRHFRISTW